MEKIDCSKCGGYLVLRQEMVSCCETRNILICTSCKQRYILFEDGKEATNDKIMDWDKKYTPFREQEVLELENNEPSTGCKHIWEWFGPWIYYGAYPGCQLPVYAICEICGERKEHGNLRAIAGPEIVEFAKEWEKDPVKTGNTYSRKILENLHKNKS